MRRIGLGLIAALLLALANGCKKSAPEEQSKDGQKPAQPVVSAQPSVVESIPVPGDAVVHIHWVGRKQLASQTNTALAGVFGLPETAKLQAQTLDKLAQWMMGKPPETAPADPQGSNSNSPTATTTNLFRPLLDDLVDAESYVEIRTPSNQPPEFALAVRLDNQRAALWETNLAAALGPLPWHVPAAHSPEGASNGQAGRVTLKRSSDWTLIGIGPEQTDPAEGLGKRVAQKPASASGANPWLEASLDLAWLANATGCAEWLPTNLPKLSVTMNWEGNDVRTRGTLRFPAPAARSLQPWTIPTNLVQDPLISFTAVRNTKATLASLRWWPGLQFGEPPDQLYSWELGGLPFQWFFAGSTREATNLLTRISDKLQTEGNPWLAANSYGSFGPATNGNGVGWSNMPVADAFLMHANDGGSGVVYGGLVRPSVTNPPPPAELFQQVLGKADLVYYDWEMTGPRIQHWTFSGQLLRMVLHKAQLNPRGNAVAFLTALETRLGNCGTVVTRTSPDQFSLSRKSSAGLTAFEFSVLADWLESPQFPRGLQTLLGQPGPVPGKRTHAAASGNHSAQPSAPHQ
jgi:hypothetical protein